MSRATIGVIGGSGLYALAGISELVETRLETPFGAPSDSYFLGRLHGRQVAFLARHGRGHRILPSELNFRANIYGFKMLGVERILTAGAVGSMKEEIRPLDIVVPDQYIDRTRGRASTFFGEGLVAHVGFADPVCGELVRLLAGCARESGARVHEGGTYLCMEGPAFSTRAESLLYRSWGVSVIGMTTLQEAKLAREAEICYATLALATDYDCWHESEEAVTVAQVLANLGRNAKSATDVIGAAIARLPEGRTCACHTSLSTAIVTDLATVPPATLQRLSAILAPYLPEK
jgi:5'-methylthioadenosine phosphorylase